ncbi:hypothetical protein K7640_23250 [Micromonospora sp. PLK6-60]|uniref:hypothetical protein n=1 Tax=Micromonospora sp. PLK6-60 TaxID=2873383 RepID=UPI001CA78D68|nr:hypothetical protein [Micromonospora sp. PLK6-60]MBY8874750.1 hypothetical protein [Micromonospora sp. PLK6-60]
MSDRLDAMFESLHGERAPGPFAPPEAVRRRGRQRTRHQAMAAGLAVVAVTGAGFGWAGHLRPVDPAPIPAASGTTASTPPASVGPSPSGPARDGTPSAGPRPTGTGRPDATPATLSDLRLRAEDLGPGAWRPRPPTEPFSGDTWRWADLCPLYRSADYPSLAHQAELDVTGFTTGKSYLYEHLHRYADGWGPRAFADVRRVVDRCTTTATTPPTAPGSPETRTLVVRDRDFAGDEAVLVREEQTYYEGEVLARDPLVTLTAAVRVGDRVATVIFSPDWDEAYAREVTRAAAQRLAAG